ncbi:hypothetical protein [Chitinophaga sp. sic0106]|uniref:hypothetical protein n=1 Tax=Chitinophaga sp. sic0106 TaxID=2854785 RepID=UPI001C478653|nr:hypothetical protein [Chitinophaga sp. sic0106]MBV7529782.1 hypothetical protein [Chitinophaga sp. sic0106]
MDILSAELLDFWKALAENNVRYIMVGGFATRFHGFNRNTDDLDMWLEDTLENRKNLIKAFTSAGFGDDFHMLETMQFVPGWTSFHIGNNIELDIMTEMKGLDNLSFQECLNLASIADLKVVQVPFLHINHLIQNKKTINRPKDKMDIEELEKIKKIRDNEEHN